MKCKAAVIIPCFKAKEKVGKLIYKIFEFQKILIVKLKFWFYL